ncbi:MAG: DUF4835 family protein [Cyclobacteriaceae bacterium]|nr:DUF4835 family protein [Cyclobacteriaceae bacterium SS2]
MSRLFFLAIFLLSFSAFGQELNCRVIINADQVQTTERSIFADMETAFAQFLNDRKWTNDEYLPEERINCNFILTLDPNETQPGLGKFGASVQILSSRPVYGTDYETVVFNFADRDWVFEYFQSQPLQFNESAFLNNITSLLAYYAYVIIGVDYDTFSEMGGTRYFQLANQVVINAQQSGYPGWQQFNSIRNRYWLTENLLSTTFEPVRKGYYSYHIKGLDIFMDKPEEARGSVLTSLKGLRTANQSRPRSILIISFLDAKAEEITQIFNEGNPSQQREAYEILTALDPSRSDTFRSIIE